jgi:aspartate carbamoyltransferase regulatory subunit
MTVSTNEQRIITFTRSSTNSYMLTIKFLADPRNLTVTIAFTNTPDIETLVYKKDFYVDILDGNQGYWGNLHLSEELKDRDFRELKVERTIVVEQPETFRSQTLYGPISERGFDRLTFAVQDLQAKDNGILHVPDDEPQLDLELPHVGDRAKKVLGFDDKGAPIAVGDGQVYVDLEDRTLQLRPPTGDKLGGVTAGKNTFVHPDGTIDLLVGPYDFEDGLKMVDAEKVFAFWSMGQTSRKMYPTSSNYVTYINNYFYFVTHNSENFNIYRSLDLLNFLNVYSLLSDYEGTRVYMLYAKGLYVTTANGKFITSVDGENWSSSSGKFLFEHAYDFQYIPEEESFVISYEYHSGDLRYAGWRYTKELFGDWTEIQYKSGSYFHSIQGDTFIRHITQGKVVYYTMYLADIYRGESLSGDWTIDDTTIIHAGLPNNFVSSVISVLQDNAGTYVYVKTPDSIVWMITISNETEAFSFHELTVEVNSGTIPMPYHTNMQFVRSPTIENTFALLITRQNGILYRTENRTHFIPYQVLGGTLCDLSHITGFTAKDDYLLITDLGEVAKNEIYLGDLYIHQTKVVLEDASSTQKGGIKIDNVTIKINENSQIYADMTVDVPDASTTVKGILKFDGDTLKLNGEDQLYADLSVQVPDASTSVKGILKFDGNTLKLNSDEQLYVAMSVDVPDASTTVKGIAMIDGASVKYNASNQLSVPDATSTVKGIATAVPDATSTVKGIATLVPDASTSVKGILKFDGDTLKLNSDDRLYATVVVPDVPDASTTVKGILKFDGDTLKLNSDEQLYVAMSVDVPDASTTVKGVVKIDGATVKYNVSGQLTVPDATSIIKGIATAVPEATDTVKGIATLVPDATSTVKGIATLVPDATSTVKGIATLVPDATSTVKGIATLVPDASTTVKGIVKIDGSTVKYNASSQLSVPDATSIIKGVAKAIPDATSTVKGIATLPPDASTAVKGVVKIDGSTIQYNAAGQLMTVGGSSTPAIKAFQCYRNIPGDLIVKVIPGEHQYAAFGISESGILFRFLEDESVEIASTISVNPEYTDDLRFSSLLLYNGILIALSNKGIAASLNYGQTWKINNFPDIEQYTFTDIGVLPENTETYGFPMFLIVGERVIVTFKDPFGLVNFNEDVNGWKTDYPCNFKKIISGDTYGLVCGYDEDNNAGKIYKFTRQDPLRMEPVEKFSKDEIKFLSLLAYVDPFTQDPTFFVCGENEYIGVGVDHGYEEWTDLKGPTGTPRHFRDIAQFEKKIVIVAFLESIHNFSFEESNDGGETFDMVILDPPVEDFIPYSICPVKSAPYKFLISSEGMRVCEVYWKEGGYTDISMVSEDLRDIAFNKNIGIAVGEGGTILRSADYGDTWDVLIITGIVPVDFRRVVACKNWWFIGAEQVNVVKSDDGGITWTTTSYSVTATNLICVGAGFRDVTDSSNKQGLFYFRNSSNQGDLIRIIWNATSQSLTITNTVLSSTTVDYLASYPGFVASHRTSAEYLEKIVFLLRDDTGVIKTYSEVGTIGFIGISDDSLKASDRHIMIIGGKTSKTIVYATFTYTNTTVTEYDRTVINLSSVIADDTVFMNNIFFGNGIFTIVCNKSVILYSSDGILWTKDTISTTEYNLVAGAANEKNIVVVGDDGAMLKASFASLGLKVVDRPLNLFPVPNKLSYTNNQWVSMYHINDLPLIMYYSTSKDGTTWRHTRHYLVDKDPANPIMFNDVAADMMVGDQKAILYKREPLDTEDFPGPPMIHFTSVAYYDGLYMICGYDTSDVLPEVYIFIYSPENGVIASHHERGSGFGSTVYMDEYIQRVQERFKVIEPRGGIYRENIDFVTIATNGAPTTDMTFKVKSGYLKHRRYYTLPNGFYGPDSLNWTSKSELDAPNTFTSDALWARYMATYIYVTYDFENWLDINIPEIEFIGEQFVDMCANDKDEVLILGPEGSALLCKLVTE